MIHTIDQIPIKLVSGHLMEFGSMGFGWKVFTTQIQIKSSYNIIAWNGSVTGEPVYQAGWERIYW